MNQIYKFDSMRSYNPKEDHGLTKDADYLQRTQTNDGNLYVSSEAVQEFDSYGYKKYNIPNKSDIFISKLSRSALLGCCGPVFIIAIQNKFVGYNNNITKTDKKTNHTSPSSYDINTLFHSVIRGALYNNTIVGFDDFTMSNSKCQRPLIKK